MQSRSKRQKPCDEQAMFWHRGAHVFECRGCGEYFEVHSRRRYEDPEQLNMLREELLLDHTECWEFADPRMALAARRFRKEGKRRDLLKGRAAAALDRQSVSWRGRT